MSDAAATSRTRFEPPISDAGQGFWDASRAQRFVLPRCLSCRRFHWFPRELCPYCGSFDLEWSDASGQAVVYAASVQPKPAMPMLASRVPYVVALVELAEGPRMMTNIVEVDPWVVAVGDAVSLVWEPLSDGRHLPLFRPVS